MSLRTPLAQVKGLGSAKEGVSHWWAQRVTAIALVPLAIWFSFFVGNVVGADYLVAVAWIAKPANAVLLVLLLAALFYHTALGLQVVIEDYVHTEWLKLTLLLLMKFGAAILALIAIFSVLRVALRG